MASASSVLKHTQILHATLRWPEGPQDVCSVCGEELRAGQRVCVVDKHYYAEASPEGLYAHALCTQEECRERGSYVPVRSYG